MLKKVLIAIGGLFALVVVVSLVASPESGTDAQAQTPTTVAPAAPATTAAAPVTTAAPEPAQPATEIGEGIYVVGTDIQPGTYKTAGPADTPVNNCYWARLSGTGGEFEEIIANGNLQGQGTVTIDPSDVAFQSQGCQLWVRQ